MRYFCAFFFFFNDTATTEIYTLSLHDALPISREGEILLLERPVLLRPLVDRAGEGRLEAGEVRPAFVRVDVVDEREGVLAVLVVVLDGALDLDAVARGLEGDGLGMQRLAAAEIGRASCRERV